MKQKKHTAQPESWTATVNTIVFRLEGDKVKVTGSFSSTIHIASEGMEPEQVTLHAEKLVRERVINDHPPYEKDSFLQRTKLEPIGSN